MVGLFCSSAASACSTATQGQVSAWEDKKEAAYKFRCNYREVSRSTVVETSKHPENGDFETTEIKGDILNSKGKVRARVFYVITNEIGLCLSGTYPDDGQFGVIYAERDNRKTYRVIDFEEKRNR
jgi:hypothetical protein